AQILRDLQPRLRRVQDREQPEIPRDHEPGQLVEPELRPLIETALERHRAVQVDDDRRRREIEEDDRGEPEDDVRRPLLRRDADPRQADDEEDLREREIDEAATLPQQAAARSDLSFLTLTDRHDAPLAC